MDPTSPTATTLIDELSELLETAYGSSGRNGFKPIHERSGLFLVAFCGEDPVGCGAMRALADQYGVAEIKRMYSRPGTVGVGQATLAGLEAEALRWGVKSIWLETRRANTTAVRFYSKAGYRERAPYGRYVDRPEAICMEKKLGMSL